MPNKRKLLCCGQYGEWLKNNEEAQIEKLNVLISQMEHACDLNIEMLMLGDSNLSASKWNSPDYKHKNIANPLIEAISQSGLLVADLGITYTSDSIRNGAVSENDPDHIYFSSSLKEKIKTRTDCNSISDHNPIIASVTFLSKQKCKSEKKIRPTKNINPNR